MKSRRPLTVVSGTSALLAVLAIAGCARSYWIVDQLRYQGWKHNGELGRAWIKSEAGGLAVGYAQFSKSFYFSPIANVADYPNGFKWSSWPPPVSDVSTAIYQRLGVDWSSDEATGAYQTQAVHFPYWLIVLLAMLLPARWALVRRANRHRVGFEVSGPPAASTPSAPAGTPA